MYFATCFIDKLLGLHCHRYASMSPTLQEPLHDSILITPCKCIHTFGLSKPIDIAFFNAHGVIIESHRAIGTNRVLRCKTASGVIERWSTIEPWFSVSQIIAIKPIDEGAFYENTTYPA